MLNFTAGLLAIGEIRDEINFNIQKAISRIQRINFSDADLATVIASGRPYDTDENYIYVVRETPIEYNFDVDGSYTVSDHGIEFFTSTTSIPVVCETLYGQNLKDKLRMDVLTISQQTLTDPQKAQVLDNIGAADAEDTKAAMGIVEDGNTATQAIAAGEFVIWKGGVYTADSAIASGATLASSGAGKNLTAAAKGGFNLLNSNIPVIVELTASNVGANDGKSVNYPTGFSRSNSRIIWMYSVGTDTDYYEGGNSSFSVNALNSYFYAYNSGSSSRTIKFGVLKFSS
jgi:hypothetical protein